MKLRSGFVSNSSSSSFVVAFPKVPETVEEMQAMLFHSEKWFYGWDYSWDASREPDLWPTEEIAERVFGDMGEPMTEGQAALEISYYEDDSISYPHYSRDNEAYRAAQEEYARLQSELAERKSVEFLKENKGCAIFRFEYSDNDGAQSSAMEHKNLFKRLPHVRISHH